MSSSGSGQGVAGSGSAGAEAAAAAGSSGGGSSSIPPSATGSVTTKVPKNAPGNRSDIGWKYGVAIDGDRTRVMCLLCKKELRGIYRLKHHLAGTSKDVAQCKAVTDEIREEMLSYVMKLHNDGMKKTTTTTGSSSEAAATVENMGEKGKNDDLPSLPFKRKTSSQQETINSIFKKSLREEACQEIASFFYNNAIPFNVAHSSEFKKMFELVARHGQGFKPPSYHEIRVKYLKQQVDSTKEDLEKHRAFWKKTGCTIMTDGWTDRRRRTILNFLVNSPMGTVFLKSIDASHISKTAERVFKMIDEVVEEVGEENVVQVVTDNAANYKAAGERLMDKRKRLYWTPCAAHCIDLMLEDLEKKLPIHKETITHGRKLTTFIYSRSALISLLHQFTNGGDLIRPATTRFATSYLTLGCLLDKKGELIRMFTSNEWKSGEPSKLKDGKFCETLVMDKNFWKNITTCLKGAYPLIKVLRLVDSDEKPAMGFIYEEMDRAKEKIASAFKNVKKSYEPLWDIIDERWNNQLHRPLHAAGLYLNPIFHYAPDFKPDFEIKRGLYDCLERMVGDMEEVKKIDAQLEEFKYKKGFFGSKIALNGIQIKTPAQWWESYGDETPELQRFAIRVLSLTCSSSGCERNWSAFEMVFLNAF